MSNYLLSYRSLTYAQRVSHLLERAGIPSSVIKLPKGVSSEGCGYGIRVSGRYLNTAKDMLASADVRPRKIFLLSDDGSAVEVLP